MSIRAKYKEFEQLCTKQTWNESTLSADKTKTTHLRQTPSKIAPLIIDQNSNYF